MDYTCCGLMVRGNQNGDVTKGMDVWELGTILEGVVDSMVNKEKMKDKVGGVVGR